MDTGDYYQLQHDAANYGITTTAVAHLKHNVSDGVTIAMTAVSANETVEAVAMLAVATFTDSTGTRTKTKRQCFALGNNNVSTTGN